MKPPSTGFLRAARRGYILLEAILALMVFAVAVLGLARALGICIESAGALNHENDIRVGLRSFLEEMRRKPITDMATSYEDARLGVTYNSTVEDLELRDRNGTVLTDLYKLRVAVNYDAGGEQREESAEVYVYKPQQALK